MREELIKLLNEYKETQRCLEKGIEWLPDNDYAQAKLDFIRVIIKDLEKLNEKVLN